MAETIYLVQGNCGEYSDYREWVVCAYRSEAMAREHATKAKEWKQQHVSWDMSYEEREKLKNPYDDAYSATDVECDWTAYGVLVCDALPTGNKAGGENG